MLHTIVVDDESSALSRFERIAASDARLSVDGSFLYPEDALDFSKNHSVDLAVLDIEMPEMSGLELAERLMEIDPYIRVIFVTAYNQYALEAFRAHAVGYLLKPLDGKELAEQIDLLSLRHSKRPDGAPASCLTVRCFGRFSVYCGDETAAAIRWKTAKAEELFALLIHYEGKTKSKDLLIDMLWPELEPEKSINLFRVTCTYIRSGLAEKGFTDILVREADGYKVNTENINCELFRFRNELSHAASLELGALRGLSELYSGEYLEGKLYDWAVIIRNQLESDYKKIQRSLADAYCAAGLWTQALEVLEKALLHDPYDEETVKRIVDVNIKKGDHSSAIKAYRSFEKTLMDELGIKPSGHFPFEVTERSRYL